MCPCAEHMKCFRNVKEAVDHAMSSAHTKCFFPNCEDSLVRGGEAENVRNHICYEHYMRS